MLYGEESELYKKEIMVTNVNLLLFDEIKEEIDVEVKTRYSAKAAKAKIKEVAGKIKVIFEEPQRAITPGQSAVFYIDDIVVRRRQVRTISHLLLRQTSINTS